MDFPSPASMRVGALVLAVVAIVVVIVLLSSRGSGGSLQKMARSRANKNASRVAGVTAPLFAGSSACDSWHGDNDVARARKANENNAADAGSSSNSTSTSSSNSTNSNKSNSNYLVDTPPITEAPGTLSMCADTAVRTILIAGLPLADMPTTSPHPQARALFNQGIMLMYAFNHPSAIRSFRGAAWIDPEFALAHAFVALASGPNINMNMDDACMRSAQAALQQAVDAAKQSTAAGRPPSTLEQRLLTAVRERYANDDIDALAFSRQMAEAYAESEHQPDVAALYAESLMDLHPWQNWSLDGTPAGGTLEAVRVLEATMRQHPKHIGAHHLFIHIMEASPSPSRALGSADFLNQLDIPAGHLAHMPAHIYTRVADLATGNASVSVRASYYLAANRANEKAIAIDMATEAHTCTQTVLFPQCNNAYVGHYLTHNMQFLAVGYWKLAQLELALALDVGVGVGVGATSSANAFATSSGTGNVNAVVRVSAAHDYQRKAIDMAMQTRHFVYPFLGALPYLERYLATPVIMLATLQRHRELLELPEPVLEPGYIVKAMWAWGRGMARAALGEQHGVQQERQSVEKYKQLIARVPLDWQPWWGNNSAVSILNIASETLRAAEARARHDMRTAGEHVQMARAMKAQLLYDEPDQWFYDFNNLLLD